MDKITKIKFEEEEISNYKWIDIYELEDDLKYGKIVNKIKKVLAINDKKIFKTSINLKIVVF